MFVYGKDLKVTQVSSGISRKVLAHSENVMPCEITLKKGEILPEHAHVHEQVSYIVSGKCIFTVDGESATVCAGDSVFMPSNAPHVVEVLEDTVIIDIFSPMREDFI